MTTTRSLNSFADELQLEQSHAYVVHHLLAGRQDQDHRYPERQGPAVTITHQRGSGAREIADAVAHCLDVGPVRPEDTPWRVFDRELAEAALRECRSTHRLGLSAFVDYRPYMQEVLEEILDLRPPSAVLAAKLEEIVWRLARLGRVVLMGHSANVILAKVPAVFHVRIVAPMELRLERVQRREGICREKALESLKLDDRRRQLYVKQRYQKRWDDELLYDLVLNTQCMETEAAAQLIVQGARCCFSRAEACSAP